MKKLLKLFVLMTVAVIAFVSCQQEIENNQALGEVTIRVHALANDLESEDPETRTYIDTYQGTANTILWGTGEYMKLAVTAGGNNVFANSTDASADLFDGEPTALFEFSVSPESAASYTYQGLYPASAAVASNNTNPASYKVNLPATQNATASSYDPAAYIMVAQPEIFNSVETDWSASFRRATALNTITLKNTPAGKSIKRVTVTAPDGKYLAGGRHIDLTTGDSGDIYSGGGRTETVEVKFATPIEGGSNIDVWFTSWGVELAENDPLTVVMYTTDKKSYTRTINARAEGILFQEGCLNTLGISMSGVTPEDVTEMEEGDYLVLAKDGENYYALKAEKAAGKERLLSVAYTGSLVSYLGDADIIWSLTKSGDSFIFENSSKYLGYKGSDNESYWLAADEDWTTTNYLLDITAQGGASNPYYVTLHSNASRYLSKNSTGDFFAFYGNTSQKADIVFVPATVDNRTVATLSFAEDAVALTTADYDSFLGQDVTASPNVAAITGHLNWSKEDNDSVIDEFDDGVLTLTGNEGTATVTVSFAGDANYRPAEASYTITVSAASGPQYTQVTSLSNVVAGTYVIVNDGYYLPNAAATSAGPAKSNETKVTVSAGVITSAVTDAMTWTFSGSTSGMTIESTANAGDYLYVSGNGNTNLRVSTTQHTWTIADYSGTAGAFSLKDNTQNRYCATYSAGSDWRSYNSYNAGNYGDGGKVYLYKLADNRADASLAWKKGGVAANSDTATMLTGDDTMPTIALDNSAHSHAVTYSSSNTDVATIVESGVGAGTITLVSAGETTISAIFAGDVDFKPLTVSYTLTVTDSRTKVATPTFSPAAGEVAENSTVTISCGTAGATIHYTTNGSTPTTESATYSSPITIDAAKTIKAIAVKDDYKNSDVAEAAYTIQGVQANDGSLEHPYTVAEALAIIAGYSDKQKSASQVYVSGIIAQVGAYNGTYNSVTYDISDDGTTSNMLNIYSGKYVANTNFSSNDWIKAGDEVTVYGYLYLYSSTKEMYQNNYIYSLNGLTALPTVTKTDIEGVAAAGVAGATTTVSFSNNAGWNVTVAGDNTIVTSASIAGTTITYTVASNAGDARTGSITITFTKSGFANVTETISVSQLAGNGNTSTTDTITSGTFSGTATSISMTTAKGVTISQLKDDGTNVNTTYNTVSTLRVYRANKMQFTGKTFTRIEMYYSGSYSGASWTVSDGGGTVSIDSENNKVVWTNNSGASTVTLKNSTASGTNTQLRTTKFVVTYN